MNDANPAPDTNPAAPCPCGMKPMALCTCAGVTPIDNKIRLVILQHPQEQDRTLGSAPLAVKLFKNAQVKIGLSWPSLSKMLGREAEAAKWGVLYLGSADAKKLLGLPSNPQGGAPQQTTYDPLQGAAPADAPAILALNRKSEIAENQSAILRGLEGVIVLDGTWSQAKALWWRNAWMLKCRRLILNPNAPSRYGNLRKEPRRDALSTIEAAALLLAHLEHRPDYERAAGEAFAHMLARFRDVKHTHPELTRR